MPRRCIAANCSNEPSEQVSLFRFPKDENISREWTLQVQRTRGDWKGPTNNTVVCSEHFTPECFSQVTKLKEGLGFNVQHRRILLPSAIPTIFSRKREGDLSQSAPKRLSSAVQKLETKRVAAQLLKQVAAEKIPDQGLSRHTINVDQDDTWNIDARPSVCETSCQTDFPKTSTRNVSVTAKVRGKSKGVQTESVSNAPERLVSVHTQTATETSDCSEEESEEESPPSSEYIPSSESDNESSFSENETEEQMHNNTTKNKFHKERKFIIFISALLRLLSWCSCPSCGHRDLRHSQREIGTMLIITLVCLSCDSKITWHSQPYLGKIPAGNILLSGAILFAGASVTKVLRVLSHMGIATISARTFFRHQTDILFKTIRKAWAEHQAGLFAALQGYDKRLICGGDGRADSPGHSAKYGTYTIIELQEKVVLDIQLVQSNEVGGSYHMEKEGLIRCQSTLHQHNLEIDVLVTDRHRQIAKYLHEEHHDIQHLFDVWHVAKGIKTKLRAVGRKGGCHDINPWISSIVNHLYWSASSTSDDERELIAAKWRSILDHVQNHHENFGGPFDKCSHGPLEGREARKKWISPPSRAAVELEKVVTNASLCRDLKHLSGEFQTSVLEAFHSLLIQFAPKMYVYTYEGMLCRTMLAALHFNENARRKQRTTQEGKQQYTLHYPKFKHGGYVIKKVLVDPTFDYVDELMTRVANTLNGEKREDTVPELLVPAPLNANFIHPSKPEAVQAHVSRFQST